MKRNFLYCVFLVILLLQACSFNTPSVVLSQKQRIYSYDEQGVVTERLSVFMLLDDNDGRNDYKELLLHEDATGLEWSIRRENTVFLQEAAHSKNVQWVGSNKFRYPRRFFPAGHYTVTAVDLSGNKAEAAFSLQEPQVPAALPFTFALEQEQWVLQTTENTSCTFFSLIMLSADLQPLTVSRLETTAPPFRQNGSLRSLQEAAVDARYIQCFAETSDRSIGFLSTPLALQ